MRVGIFVALLIAAVCAVAAPPPKARPKVNGPLYFPTQKGARWVYKDIIEEARVVSDVRERAGEKHVTVSILMKSGKELPYEVWAVSEKGLALLWLDGAKFDDPVTMLRLPWKGGQKWEVRARGRDLDEEEEGSATVLGEEEVEVPAGKFKALRVEREMEIVRGKGVGAKRKTTRWFAPGVGIVKLKVGATETDLKAFTDGTAKK